MYVCLCHSVTEKQVKEAIFNGAKCIKDLRVSLRITTKCGRCTSCARDCLKRAGEPTQTLQTAQYLLAGAS